MPKEIEVGSVWMFVVNQVTSLVASTRPCSVEAGESPQIVLNGYLNGARRTNDIGVPHDQRNEANKWGDEPRPRNEIKREAGYPNDHTKNKDHETQIGYPLVKIPPPCQRTATCRQPFVVDRLDRR